MSIRKRESRWRGFRSQLCPIDFSDHSRVALRYAEQMALRAGGTLAVIYASDPLLVAAAAAALHDRGIARRSAIELRSFVEGTLQASSMERLRVVCHAPVGDPVDAILKAAARRRSHVIVMGTHGLTGAERLLMGSTTLRVLQRTRVPVLAVPRARQSGDVAASASWPADRIVAALELDRGSDRQVAAAASIAEWFGSSLLLLHVLPQIAAPAWLKRDLSAHEQTRMAEAQRRLEKLADLARPRVETATRVISGRASDEIAALAVAERCGLVITTLRDTTGWLGPRRGSVSYQVLAHAATPVLACPPRWRPR